MQAGDLDRLQLGEGGRRSAAFSSNTEKLDLGRKKVSGKAGWLGGSACPFKDRRRGNGEANGPVLSLGVPLAWS